MREENAQAVSNYDRIPCENQLLSYFAMRRPTLLVPLLAALGNAAVIRVPIQSGLVLQPDESRTLTVESGDLVEIGWQTVNHCDADCIQMTDMTRRNGLPFRAANSALGKYTPVDGKVSVEYKNISRETVTLDIYRLKRTCDAEACKFLDPNEKGKWLVFKIDEFKGIATSKDRSYSTVSGVATSGRLFTIRVIWWTDDKNTIGSNCAIFIKRYLDSHTPKEQYRPYILSGQEVGQGDPLTLKSIDTCVPKAPNFGVPEKNVFR